MSSCPFISRGPTTHRKPLLCHFVLCCKLILVNHSTKLEEPLSFNFLCPAFISSFPLISRYIIASQDPELRAHVHQQVIGSPILYLHQSAPTLEKPTEKCLVAAQSPGRWEARSFSPPNHLLTFTLYVKSSRAMYATYHKYRHGKKCCLSPHLNYLQLVIKQ